jgi:hypothetical protein
MTAWGNIAAIATSAIAMIIFAGREITHASHDDRDCPSRRMGADHCGT